MMMTIMMTMIVFIIIITKTRRTCFILCVRYSMDTTFMPSMSYVLSNTIINKITITGIETSTFQRPWTTYVFSSG